MCRFLLITGQYDLGKDLLKAVLWSESNSLFRQCFNNPNLVNLDGFGVGYYYDGNAYVYRNCVAGWNDPNLCALINCIKTKCVVAHIRAKNPINCSLCNNIDAPVHIYNCHPFKYKNLMFCHNGIIEAFYNGKHRKEIINEIDDTLITEIQGNTDSEYLFYLLLTYIKKNNNDCVAAIKQLIYFFKCFEDNFILNFILTDSVNSYVLRYSYPETYRSPSLYSLYIDDLQFFASEPLFEYSQWKEISRNTLHVVENKLNQEQSMN